MSEQRFDFKCVLRARLEKIINLHGQTLHEVVCQREPISQEAYLSNNDLILRFAGSDPTPGKSRTQWLIKTYIQDEQFKLEDLGRVDAALAAFERFKRKLPVEQRELSRLTSFRALEALVDPFVRAEAKARLERDLSTATGREKRRLEELKALDESIIIQKEDGLPTIAVPMTEFASKWWGRGTQWCTAAEKDNAFTQYHEAAPLMVIVCPDGAKFQMYVSKVDIQFMDNTDQNIDYEIIQERWNEFQSLLYWAIHQNGDALQHIPKDHKTHEYCRIAVEQKGEALGNVPGEYRTLELCRIAVVQNGLALKAVPENLRTPELCQIAVEQNGWALAYVPEKYKTLELCRVAIEQNGEVLTCIPLDKRTPEIYSMAMQKHGESLYYVPENQRTPELCRIAIVQNGRALRHVPEKLRTQELCRLAVEPNGYALLYVPQDYKSSELCHIAVEQNGMALEYLPKNQRTPELCRMAVEQNGLALEYIPENKRTTELYRIAIQKNGLALQYVPEDKKTKELCRMAISQNGKALVYLPEKYRTPEILALIPPVQPKWHPDILQGLGNQPRVSQDSQINHNDDNTLFTA
jgi:Domain of unknown function (DUF4116)